MTDTGPPRLDQEMNDRRLQLDLTWKQVAERAGITEFHLQRIRSGKAGLTDRAASKIDRSMGWKLGSTKQLYNTGSEPALASAQTRTAPPIPDGVMVDPADWAAMTAQERTELVKLVTGVRRRRQAARGA